ncbi:Domain unknown function DUF295 - like 1 [Theobroma cacao]|nr:Domain unknown function DUF295 - like 1 [Theobroma cacao]
MDMQGASSRQFESTKSENTYAVTLKQIDVEEYDCCAHFTKSFKANKLVWIIKVEKEVKYIDEDIVFMGDNWSLAILALDFPKAQPNSIYFTNDYFFATTYESLGPRDIDFFNMKDGNVRKHYQFKPSHKLKRICNMFNGAMISLIFSRLVSHDHDAPKPMILTQNMEN